MNKHYKLRVSLNEISLEDAVKLIHKQVATYAVCVEGTGEVKPHCHFYLVTDLNTVKEPAMRQQYRKTFGLAGNKLWSLSELDVDEETGYALEYLAYMFKEGTPVFQNIPEEIQIKAKLHQQKVKEDMKKKKAEKRTQLQRIEEEYKDRLNNGFEDLHTMTELVVKWTKENKVPVRRFSMVSLIETLLLKYSPHYENELSQALYSSMCYMKK